MLLPRAPTDFGSPPKGDAEVVTVDAGFRALIEPTPNPDRLIAEPGAACDWLHFTTWPGNNSG